MSNKPWFKFYPSDWLGGTAELTVTELAVYITLIAQMYDHGEPLELDVGRLSKRLNLQKSRADEAIENLVRIGKLIRLENGRYWNPRTGQEVEKRNTRVANLVSNLQTTRKTKPNKNNAKKNQKDVYARARQKPEARYESTNVDSTLSAHGFADNTQASFLTDQPEKPVPKKPKSAPDIEAFKAEIATVLDADRVEAVCAVRRKKGATFSAHAGRLLVAALAACPSPTHAADEMVLRNWTSVKPEWLDRGTTGGGAARPKSEFRKHQDETDRLMGRSRENDDEPIDYFRDTNGNWRSH